MIDDNDPLFEKLTSHEFGASPIADAPRELQDAIFAQTQRALRVRRLRRRAVYAAGLAAVYLAGVATTWAFAPDSAEPQEAVAKAPVEEEPHTRDTSPADKPLTEAELLDAEQVALRLAKLDEAAQAQLLRKAADAYLREQDFPAALTYYRQYLKRIEPAERARPDMNDSWLLLSLKHDHSQEIHYANSSGR